MIRLGHAAREIEVGVGLTLCGFAGRRELPSTSVHDPLTVQAVAVDDGERRCLLLVADLLALGREATEALHRALDARLPGIGREARLLCCTHTHSAPAAITLHGCGRMEASFVASFCRTAAEAAVAAVEAMQPVRLEEAAVVLPGFARNRRCILADGRIAMQPTLDDTVLDRGPAPDTMTLLRAVDGAGRPVCCLAHFACHPVTACTGAISADWPGELRRRLTIELGAPVVFLQGACGDLNPPVLGGPVEGIAAVVDGLLATWQSPAWQPVVADRIAVAATAVPQAYGPRPKRAELCRTAEALAALAAGGEPDPAALSVLSDWVRPRPGHTPDPVMRQHIALCLSRWAESQLAKPDAAGEDLAVRVLSLGSVVFCAVAAEPFAVTAQRLQAMLPERTVLLVGYASPLVGYLPTDEALAQGGYEADDAYRYYDRPAPFAKGAESAFLRAAVELVRKGT